MSTRMVVGLIADTHGLLRPQVFQAFAGVTLIVHAGDVGGGRVLDELERIAPVEAVGGNVDDPHDPTLIQERSIPVGALALHVSHGHELGSPTPGALLARYAGDILVYGHTHRPLIHREGLRLVVNPGSAGPRRFKLPVTVAKLTLAGVDASVEFVSLIE